METAAGARILGEVEEMSLEEALDNVRTSVNSSNNRVPLKNTHIPELDDIAVLQFRATQAPALTISGRYLPMLYTLTSLLVSSPHCFTLLVIDLEGRFDATCLSCEASDARHLYIHFPSQASALNASTLEEGVGEDRSTASSEEIRTLVTEATDFMLYGDRAAASASRRWWGTIVIGGFGGGDIVAGWKGWLRVFREEIPSFSLGSSAEEALGRRVARQEAVDAAGWAAGSKWGGFVFREGN